MAALGLERQSHEEFRAHVTIPITPLLNLHNRVLLFSPEEFIDWGQLGKINFGEGESPCQVHESEGLGYSSLATNDEMQAHNRDCLECSQGSQF
jgi:hypothetical protein